MSEVFEIELLLRATIILFEIGRRLAKMTNDKDRTYTLRLTKRQTQIADGDLLRWTLSYLGYQFAAGDRALSWDVGQPIELAVLDEEGRLWFAFGRDQETKSYFVIALDTDTSQTTAPTMARFSDKDPSPHMSKVVQYYAFIKAIRTLLQNGYEVIASEEDDREGSRIVTLRKQDSTTGDLHTVRMIFRAEEGQATIMTDSQQANGSRGICPNIDALLREMGIYEYNKRTSPTAAGVRAKGRKQPMDLATGKTEQIPIRKQQPRRPNTKAA